MAFRPHVKTSKCTPVARAQQAAGAKGITVSTLKEASAFFADGFDDILYAVGMVPAKLPQALALLRQGCQLKIITDSEASSAAIVAFGREHGEVFEVWLEIDSDGHRSGLKPDEPALLTVARTLHQGGMRLGGVMTHAGVYVFFDLVMHNIGVCTASDSAGQLLPGYTLSSANQEHGILSRQGAPEVRWLGPYVRLVKRGGYLSPLTKKAACFLFEERQG